MRVKQIGNGEAFNDNWITFSEYDSFIRLDKHFKDDLLILSDIDKIKIDALIYSGIA